MRKVWKYERWKEWCIVVMKKRVEESEKEEDLIIGESIKEGGRALADGSEERNCYGIRN